MDQDPIDQLFRSLLKLPVPTDLVCEGIPIFAPRAQRHRAADKYDKDFSCVDRYTGLAYGYKASLLGLGGAEGLYRTIDCLLVASLGFSSPCTILDLGCGVGRTIYDCAPLLARSFFVGMDLSYNMCQRAKQILLDGQPVGLQAWADRGFPGLVFTETRRLQNVKIAQGTACDLPFLDECFDAVTSTLLVDRVDRPKEAVREIVRVLKRGGTLILSSPLNFDNIATWLEIADPSRLIQIVEEAGAQIVEKFDGLVYREVQDVRGNHEDWLVFLLQARKKEIT
jgi:ubiquinone/menaquinone biosynthesis C-methylase UbiE